MHRDLGSQADAINSFLCGHFNYYGLPGNRQRLQALHYLIELLVLDQTSKKLLKTTYIVVIYVCGD